MQMRLVDIQQHVGGEMAGDTNIVVTAVNSLELVVSGEIAYAENNKYLAIAEHCIVVFHVGLSGSVTLH